MEISRQNQVRVFRSGALELEDPAPALPVEDAFSLHFPAFPHFRKAVLGEPRAEAGGVLVYEVELPPVKTNG